MHSHPARGLSRPGTQAPVAASPDAGNEPCDSGGGGKARRRARLQTFKSDCIFWAKKGIRPAHIARLLSTEARRYDPNDVRVVLYQARKTDPTIPRLANIGRPPPYTPAQVEWAADQADLGRQYRDIARDLNCSHSAIWRAVKRFRNRGTSDSGPPIGGSSCSPPCAPSLADTRSGRAGDGA